MHLHLERSKSFNYKGVATEDERKKTRRLESGICEWSKENCRNGIFSLIIRDASVESASFVEPVAVVFGRCRDIPHNHTCGIH